MTNTIFQHHADRLAAKGDYKGVERNNLYGIIQRTSFVDVTGFCRLVLWLCSGQGDQRLDSDVVDDRFEDGRDYFTGYGDCDPDAVPAD